MKDEVRDIIFRIIVSQKLDNPAEFAAMMYCPKDKEIAVAAVGDVYKKSIIDANEMLKLIEYISEYTPKAVVTPGTVVWPSYPDLRELTRPQINQPGTTDPLPYQLPQVWCTTKTV